MIKEFIEKLDTKAGLLHFVRNDKIRKKVAFTLAEVLITLGIIGVVAALTIPTLIQNMQHEIYINRLKQSYAQIVQAMRLAEVDYGLPGGWDINLNSDRKENSKLVFEKYFMPYLKGVTTCISGADHSCAAAVSPDASNYVLNNGVGISFVTDREGEYFSLNLDVNGPKKPNSQGRDAFCFHTGYNKNVFYPCYYKEGLTLDDFKTGYKTRDLNSKYTVYCKKKPSGETDPNDLYRHGCATLLFMNGFKAPKDYPW